MCVARNQLPHSSVSSQMGIGRRSTYVYIAAGVLDENNRVGGNLGLWTPHLLRGVNLCQREEAVVGEAQIRSRRVRRVAATDHIILTAPSPCRFLVNLWS